jgi:hypothetical protein
VEQEKRLSVRDTLLLGVAGGLYIASLFIVPDIFFMKRLEETPLVTNMLHVIIALSLMSFIELRLSTRAKEWRSFNQGGAFALALGLSIVCGYVTSPSEGMLQFVVLLPLALTTVTLAESLFSKTPANKP